MTHRPIRSLLLLAALAIAPLGAAQAEEPIPLDPFDGLAQDDAEDDGTDDAEDAEDEAAGPTAPPPERQRPPQLPADARLAIDFVDAPITDVIKHFAEVMGRNFILTDDLKGEITIISHTKVSRSAAWEAFVSALAVEGYTLVTTGNMTKVVPITEAAGEPVGVYQGGNIPYTDNFVTQIIQLDSVAVNDVSSVVKELAGKGANIIAYAPTNTLIISGPANNIRRVYRIISQLDVAAPKAKLAMVTLQHAEASEVQAIIDKLYGSGESTQAEKPNPRSSRNSSRRNRRNPTPEPEAGASASKVGAEGKYIQQIIADERTNSLLILANEEAIKAVVALIEQIDVDVDPTSRARINVVYLEHAKAEDVAQVLTNLAQGGSGSGSSNSNNRNSRVGPAARGRAGQPGAPGGAGAEGDSKSAVAAFDSGMRIASDENTNALVVIATKDDFEVISDVIEKLDRRRQQVFVEAVILELSTEDDNSFGLAVHGGGAGTDGSAKVGSAQLGASSIFGLGGFTSDVLSGLAVGVFGPEFEVDSPLGDGSTVGIPAFGVVLNALQSSSSVNILSTPNILTMDNEEAKIVVGRNVPFPVGTTQNNLGTPIISFQREDVAITLRVTPQINESDYVTLEVFQEVQELESDPSSLDPLTSGGPVTSKRSIENTVVVKDNQTIVLGGLIGETDNQVETKVPILGDIPLVGRLFRGQSQITRRTNLMIFLTPHIINEPADLEEVYRIKTEQRREFVRRFYGKSREEQEAEMRNLLSYSMNQVDKPSRYRGPTIDDGKYKVIGEPMDPAAEDAPDESQTSDRTGRMGAGKRRIGGRAILINETVEPEPPASGDEATPVDGGQ